jgi:ATP-dependent DNA helicase RecG
LTICENIVIEFKRAGDGPKHDTYESICAFLNRNGGDVLYSGVEPIFDESDVFRLTIPLNDDYSPEKGTTDKTTEKTTEKATEKNAGQGTETVESRIRKLVCDNPTISMKEMAQILGMTNDGVYYHIKGLRNAGKLRRVGGRKIGHWEFKD